jgi:iron complex transport system permease protein
MDEESAAALGVDVRKVERQVYAASSLVVGVAVAVAGPIGFVGLIVPHAVRLVLGEDLRIVIPCSMLLGAGFLVAADTLARTMLGANELPVGAVTALVGGPLFLVLLARKTRYAAI